MKVYVGKSTCLEKSWLHLKMSALDTKNKLKNHASQLKIRIRATQLLPKLLRRPTIGLLHFRQNTKKKKTDLKSKFKNCNSNWKRRMRCLTQWKIKLWTKTRIMKKAKAQTFQTQLLSWRDVWTRSLKRIKKRESLWINILEMWKSSKMPLIK